MNWTAIEHFLDIVTPLFTLLTILLVYFQTRYLTEQTRHSSTATIAAMYKEIAIQMIEIDKLFVAEPQLRPYFYDNLPISDTTDNVEKQKVYSVAETFLDFFDLIITSQEITHQYHTEKSFERHLLEWRTYIASVYRTSPTLRDTVAEHEDWYLPVMIEIFHEVDKSDHQIY